MVIFIELWPYLQFTAKLCWAQLFTVFPRVLNSFSSYSFHTWIVSAETIWGNTVSKPPAFMGPIFTMVSYEFHSTPYSFFRSLLFTWNLVLTLESSTIPKQCDLIVPKMKGWHLLQAYGLACQIGSNQHRYNSCNVQGFAKYLQNWGWHTVFLFPYKAFYEYKCSPWCQWEEYYFNVMRFDFQEL